ncbi:MAG: hypothetical protein Q8S33_09615, partial [Myxococcales bacterium]|nr:hypothetical protein [Myxococcales bacterium]
PAGGGAATEPCACSACLEQEASSPFTQTRLGQPPPAHLVSLPTTSPPGALSGTDVLRCPCGGRRRIIAIHSTRKAAEQRLTQLGHHLTPRRLLPPATAQPALPLAG